MPRLQNERRWCHIEFGEPALNGTSVGLVVFPQGFDQAGLAFYAAQPF